MRKIAAPSELINRAIDAEILPEARRAFNGLVRGLEHQQLHKEYATGAEVREMARLADSLQAEFQL